MSTAALLQSAVSEPSFLRTCVCPPLSLSEMQKAGPGLGSAFCLRVQASRGQMIIMLSSLSHPAAQSFRRFDDPLPMARNRSDPGNATTTHAHVGTVRPAQHADENELAAAPLEHGPSRITLAGT